ncbi:MAG: hypothetical protein O7C75_17820, partial [Verrucomicrobia bacterium]|nr:hypothetical protein [Verrucomicrobiota bacterium]
MQNWLTSISSKNLLKICAPLFTLALFLTGCATPKTAVDYIDGTPISFAPVMVAQEEAVADERFNVAINLFLPGADLEKLEEEGAGLITTDKSGTPKIDHKAVDPKIRRLETHFFPIALKNALDKSQHWGQTFISPGEVQSPDLYINANILASDGHSIALLVYVTDSTGRVWYNDTIEYQTLELDYDTADWPNSDPYDAVFNHIANQLVDFRNKLTPDEQ